MGKKDAKQNRSGNTPPKNRSGMSLQNVMDDLNVRFIINCPEEELRSLERVFTQVEQACWFYEDFYRATYKHLPHLGLKEFSKEFVKRCPTLKKALGLADEDAVATALNSFTKYKRKVPVCGCIMLNSNMDQCVLVKGWIPGSSWSFPKGKINADEPELDCAVREVLEETGFDTTNHIHNPETDFIERNERGQKIRLYIARDVPSEFQFLTQTRKEISEIRWFDLTSLQKGSLGQGEGLSIFTAARFVTDLTLWVEQNRGSIDVCTSTTTTNTITSHSTTPTNNSKPTKSQRKKKNKSSSTPTSTASSPRESDVETNSAAGNPKDKRRSSTCDVATFGAESNAGWSVEDMFEVNERKFGIVNSFNINEYTTPLPDAATQAKALEEYQRLQATHGTKVRSRGRSTSGKSPKLQPQPKQQRDMRRHSVGSGAELAPSVASMFAAFSQSRPTMPPLPPQPTSTSLPAPSLTAPSLPANNSFPANVKSMASEHCGALVAPPISFSFNREEILSCI